MARSAWDYTGAGGAGRFIGRGVPTQVPIDLDPAEWDGALLYGEDSALWWSDGVEWRTSAEATRSLTVESMTVEVLASGTPNNRTTFASLRDAIAYLSGFRPSSTAGTSDEFLPFRQGVVVIKSGHVVRDQIIIQGSSLAWVQVVSEDAVVLVDESAITLNAAPYESSDNFPFITVQPGSVCFRIKTMFECDPDGDNRNTIGLRLRGGSYVDDLNADDATPALHGFRGFNNNVELNGGGYAFFSRKTIEAARNLGCSIGGSSSLRLFGCRVVGGGLNALRVSHTSHAIVQFVAGLPAGFNVCRADPAGAVDGADIFVLFGGMIVVTTGILGAISNDLANGDLQSNGIIIDQRVARRLTAIMAPRSYTFAARPAASAYPSHLIHVSDGNAGAPCLAVSDGTNWLRIPLGAAVSTSV